MHHSWYFLLVVAIAFYAVALFYPFLLLKQADSLPTLDWAPGYYASDAEIRMARVIPFATNKLKNPVIRQNFINTLNGNNKQSFKSY